MTTKLPERATLATAPAQPAGWKFERVDDRHIRVEDPAASYAVVIDMGDQAPVMRVFWRLCVDLIEWAASAAAPAVPPRAGAGIPEGWALIPLESSDALLRPFFMCPPEELKLAWQAMHMIAKKMHPAPAVSAPAVEDLMTKIQAFGLACYQHEAACEQISMQVEIRADLQALAAAPAVSAPAEAAMGDWEMGDWQQYAKEGETAQACIERHRAEHDSLLRLLAEVRTEQGRAYRCIQGLHNALTAMQADIPANGYHAPTIAAAKRFVFEGSLEGSEYFIGKPVDVLHAALALPNSPAPVTGDAA